MIAKLPTSDPCSKADLRTAKNTTTDSHVTDTQAKTQHKQRTPTHRNDKTRAAAVNWASVIISIFMRHLSIVNAKPNLAGSKKHGTARLNVIDAHGN